MVSGNQRVFTTRGGVILHISPVPSLVVVQAQKRLTKPAVPIVQIEGKARTEENPMDPDYIKAVAQYNQDLGLLINDVYLANGVQVFEVPIGKYALDSDEWVDGLRFVGIDVPQTGIARRVAWLKYHLIDDVDLGDIITTIAAAGGAVTEEQVQQAAESFRDNQARNTNTELHVVEEQPS